MVLDNLKDYAVRALVNAVDHLGTVAYKLTDLFEQQTLDISTLELKISCLNQQILTCETYTDKEGLRQQRMVTNNPRHHKHYILPNSVSRQVQSSSQLHKDANLNHVQPQPRPHPPGTPASKTLSWHLASETNSASDGTPHAASCIGDIIAPKITSEAFHFLDKQDTAAPMPLSTHLQSAGGNPTSSMALRSFGIRDSLEPSKPLTAFRSFDNPGRLQIYRPPVRSKSMLSAFFAKNKSLKPRKASIT
ncbi:probable protein ABIL1 isoform X2 [Phoenix dactylifera]|nr:probable protein ABIL1 isoform X2 [Phoenix dactylifera]